MTRNAGRVGFYVQTFEALGVEYLSATLKGAGFETRIFFDPALGSNILFNNRLVDRLLSFEDLLIQEMLEADLDVMAFSVTTDTFPKALKVATKFKQRSDIPTVFGGIHVTCAPERVAAKPAVDYAIIGEGEEALVELVEALQHGESGTDIANVCCRRNGEVIVNPPRPLAHDLDALPLPDKSLFWDEAPGFRTSQYTIVASRGCLYSCTYCCNSALRHLYKGKGKWLRRRSVDSVIEELELAVQRYNPKEIRFWDDNFVTDLEWLEEFSAKYAARVGLPFFAWACPRHTTREAVALLKTAGVREINLGVQTLHESTRRKYLRRYDTNDQIAEAIAAVRDAGVFLSTDNIVQLPGQTIAEARELAQFYVDNPVDLPYVFILRYYPGTRIARIAHEEGILSDADMALLEDPPEGRPNSVAQPEDEKAFLKIRDFILLTGILPHWLSRFMLRHNRYEYLPASATAAYLSVLCGAARRLFTRKRHMPCGFRLVEYVLRYMRFAWIKFRWRLGRNMLGSGGAGGKHGAAGAEEKGFPGNAGEELQGE